MRGPGHAQVWWADLDSVRPVVVLTRDRVAHRLSRVLVAPVTTTVRGLATEVTLGAPEGLRDGCVATLDNVELLPVSCRLRRAGRVAPDRWQEFCTAMHNVMGC